MMAVDWMSVYPCWDGINQPEAPCNRFVLKLLTIIRPLINIFSDFTETGRPIQRLTIALRRTVCPAAEFSPHNFLIPFCLRLNTKHLLLGFPPRPFS